LRLPGQASLQRAKVGRRFVKWPPEPVSKLAFTNRDKFGGFGWVWISGSGARKRWSEKGNDGDGKETTGRIKGSVYG
jgi:hypothetical protein